MIGDRGVSTVVSYVLTLGVTSLLVVGLLVATGGYVADQRQATVRDELQVIGQQIAADVAAADRLVRAGGTTVRVTRDFPEKVTGISYRIEINPGTPTTLRLSTDHPDVTVEVTVRTTTGVAETTLSGGDIVVVYTGSQLEVRDG